LHEILIIYRNIVLRFDSAAILIVVVAGVLFFGVAGMLYWKYIVVGTIAAAGTSKKRGSTNLDTVTEARKTDLELRMSDGAGITVNPIVNDGYMYDTEEEIP
jgi:hypothetical protein